MSPTILFYDDVTEFGGHEKMSVSLIGQILRFSDCRVVFVHSETNDRLVRALNSLSNRFSGRLSLLPVPFRSGMIPTLELFWQVNQVITLSRLFKDVKPSFAVIVQGNIELSVKGLVAARLAGVRTISYLPSVRRFGDIEGIPFGKLRDVLNRVFYRLIDGFILISENDCRDLRKTLTLGHDTLFLVKNLIDAGKMHRLSTKEARQTLKLPEGAAVITIIGRIYFKGKGQDFAVRALRGMLGDKLRLMIVGDGPDRDALFELARDETAAGTVVVKEWLDDPSVAYCASDIVLMPSTLEGVPLVLLEALYFGKKVLASDIPPFDEYLPANWRFRMGDAESLRNCLSAALGAVDSPDECNESFKMSMTDDSNLNGESIRALIDTMTRSAETGNSDE